MGDTSAPTVTIRWWVGLLRQSGAELNGLQWEAVGWVSLRLWSFSPGKVVRPGCLLWSTPAPPLIQSPLGNPRLPLLVHTCHFWPLNDEIICNYWCTVKKLIKTVLNEVFQSLSCHYSLCYLDVAWAPPSCHSRCVWGVRDRGVVGGLGGC